MINQLLVLWWGQIQENITVTGVNSTSGTTKAGQGTATVQKSVGHGKIAGVKGSGLARGVRGSGSSK
jgi:hypothetical protein